LTEQLTDPGILRKIPIFSSLSDADLSQILKAPENSIVEYGPKETIIKESEIGMCMYVVLEGTVEVLMRGLGREINIATLRAGDFFGEQALTIMDATGRRNATVKTMHKSRLFRIDKKYVKLSLSSDHVGPEDLTVPHAAPLDRDKEVRELIKGMRLFEMLKETELKSIGTWTEILNVGPGDFVIKESEKANCMYVVLEGSVEIFTLDDDGKVTVLASHERGGYFGEQALLPGSTGIRTAYARTNARARLIRIPKAYFRLILTRDVPLAQTLSQIGQDQKKQRDQIHKK
jgi:CRP-like cAMP-binding protein